MSYTVTFLLFLLWLFLKLAPEIKFSLSLFEAALSLEHLLPDLLKRSASLFTLDEQLEMLGLLE
jgi:hypothetical protein